MGAFGVILSVLFGILFISFIIQDGFTKETRMLLIITVICIAMTMLDVSCPTTKTITYIKTSDIENYIEDIQFEKGTHLIKKEETKAMFRICVLNSKIKYTYIKRLE